MGHWEFPLLQQPLTTTMKAVLALLLVCLVQISSAEEQENIANEGNLLLQREVREAARGKNKAQGCDKKCKQGKREKRDRKKLRQLKKKKNKKKKKPPRQGKKKKKKKKKS